MMRKVYKSLFCLALPLATVGTLVCASSVRAQSITPDGTLGNESSAVTRDVVIRNILSDRIDGGATRGNNLFHSFSEFNINEANRGAYFSNPEGIENIVSRVTGSNVSNIRGTLGVLGNANLFFANPNGVVFGPGARLDVSGSFFATTSDSFIFDNGFEFGASNPQAPPLLTINIPIGLRFRDNPGSITNESMAVNTDNTPVGLQVSPGKTLALVGGDVNFEGGRVTAPGARVEIGGLAEAGTIGLENNGGNFQLNFPTNVLLSDVTLANDAIVEANTSDIRGDIFVNANVFEARTGGRLVSLTQGTVDGWDITVNSNNFKISGIGVSGFGAGIYQQVLNNASGNAGKIIINTNSFNASSGGLINNTVLRGGIGNASDIIINASGNLSLESGAQINSSTFGLGNAGNVTINVPNGDVNFDGFNTVFVNGAETLARSGIQSTVEPSAKGNGNEIDIQAENLFLKNSAQINSSTFGEGDAGNIRLNASKSISVSSSSSIGALTATSGNAGNIIIKARDKISFQEGAVLVSTTSGFGNAGSVTIEGIDGDLPNISFDGTNGTLASGIFTIVGSVTPEPTEPIEPRIGGDINITAQSLELTNGAQLNSSTGGKGNAGSINIDVREGVLVQGVKDGYISGVFSNIENGGDGKGGEIKIKAKTLSLVDRAQVQTLVREAQNGLEAGKGDAGNIQIDVSDNLFLNGGSEIRSDTLGFGNAGSVTIDGIDGNLPNISFDGTGVFANGIFASGIFTTVERVTSEPTEPPESRIGGDINITAQLLKLTNGAQLNSSTGGKGNAGSINIDVREGVLVQGVKDGYISGVFSNIENGGDGKGGEIKIKAKTLSLVDRAQVQTLVRDAQNGLEAGKGDAGNIQIDVSDNLFLNGGSEIRSDTFGFGNAGSVTIEGIDGNLPNISFDGTGVFANGIFASGIFTTVGPVTPEPTEPTEPRIGGDINITAQSLELTNGAVINSSTSGKGDAGNIKLNIIDRITIAGDNSGIFASTFSTGKGGNINIDPKTVEILDKAQISAESFGTGVAGDINIVSDEIVLLRREGKISTASTQNNDGGNITINTGVLVALPDENSDISANAAQGTGGNVTIKALGIFGIVPRTSSTDFSDITATGGTPESSGIITINNPETDPNSGLIELPETVVDANKQIAQNACQQGVGSEFVATGRGGLPPDPTQDLTSSAVRVDLTTPVASKTTNTIAIQPKSTPTARKIVPAQGWIFNSKGQVVLTAYDPNEVGVQRTAHKGLCRAK